MSGRKSRNKGKSGEREVATAFREALPELAAEVRRGWQAAGAALPDVVVPTLWPEVKRGKRTNPRAALRQAIGDSAGTGRMPLAVCRDDRAEWQVTLLLDDFLELFAEAWRARQA